MCKVVVDGALNFNSEKDCSASSFNGVVVLPRYASFGMYDFFVSSLFAAEDAFL
jgi:hypothetical protein